MSEIVNIITGWRFATLLKRGSGPGVFQEVLQNFQEHQPWMLPTNGCFRKKSKTLSTAISTKHHYRRSRPEEICKKGVLQNFTKLNGKQLATQVTNTKGKQQI